MKSAAERQPQAPPGVVSTLTAGFELTTAHIWLVILPFILDLFYWLGPRLSIARLANRNLAVLLEEPTLKDTATQLIELSAQVNVFTSLSVPLIGVPALMGGAAPEETPLRAQVHEIDGMLLWMVALVSLSAIGLLLAALYLSLISLAMVDDDERVTGSAFVISVLKSAARLFGLGVVFITSLFLVWLPLLPVALLVGLLAGGLFVAVLFAGFLLVVTFLSLSVPGIVLSGRPLLRSVLESVRLVQRNVLQTFNLLLVVVLISGGTNLLWRLADDGSWLTLVSIAGHAFVSTALVAAVFVFYRDRRQFAMAEA